jgi:hypothetical protein
MAAIRRTRIDPLAVGVATGFAISLGMLPVVLMLAFVTGFMIEGRPDDAAALLTLYAKFALIPPLVGFAAGLVVKMIGSIVKLIR